MDTPARPPRLVGMQALKRQLASAASPRRIFEHLDRYVIGQERAKRTLAIAAYNHRRRLEYRERAGAERDAGLLKKSNILLVGPTGSGKTHLARHLAAVLDVPFAVVDATEYTEAGYYGRDVEQMVTELLLAADQDEQACARGIIFVDEIDKLGSRSQTMKNGSGGRDIGGEGVQQALLKLLEGRDVFVPTGHGPPMGPQDFVSVSTEDILFICAGTFSGLSRRSAQRPVGFGPVAAAGPTDAGPRVTPQGLADYGLLQELVGRLPVIVEMEPLTEDEMLRILTDPPDSIAREYRERLAFEQVQVDFDEAAFREIARHAHSREIGARGLRSIFEEVMADLMFQAPELGRERVAIDAAFVRERLTSIA